MTGLDARPLLAAPYERLSRPQRYGVALLLAVAVVFGGIVEMRSAFMHRRMTDLDTYLRAAWAVRVGSDPYAITGDNGWHYVYPPLLAVVLVPLADPPAGAARSRTVPFATSVAVWYVLNLLALALGTHALANALEGTSRDRRFCPVPVGCQRWWALRLLPVLICLIPIGGTLSRGQVNLIVLALLCAMTAAVLRGYRFRAGLWLAAAISIKAFPVFLLLYPFLRRDRRFLAGCGLGLVFGVVLIPAVVFGPARFLALERAWIDVTLRPILADDGDTTRDRELLTANDNQAFVMVIHRTVHWHRQSPPPRPSRATRLVHALLAMMFTAVILFVGRRRAADDTTEALFIGLLTVTMLLALPVCHPHYFSLALPLVMALVALGLEGEGSLTVRRFFRYVAAIYPVATALPHLPGLDVLRQFGLAMAATLALWLFGVATLWMLRALADGPVVASG